MVEVIVVVVTTAVVVVVVVVVVVAAVMSLNTGRNKPPVLATHTAVFSQCFQVPTHTVQLHFLQQSFAPSRMCQLYRVRQNTESGFTFSWPPRKCSALDDITKEK
jgi:hypothetical protein